MVSEKEIIPVRIKFSKTGNLMYISHLDLSRTMQRIIVRSGVDIWYSEGYNPQPRLTFAVPLPVGVESNCELLDFKINSYMSCEEIKARISANFPDEMKVLEVYTPSEKFKNIAYIDYTINIYSPKINESTGKEIEEIFKKECLITKKSKSGEKEINISEYIRLIEAENTEYGLTLHTVLTADNEKYLNPELLIEAIRQNVHILDANQIDEYYTVMRNNMLDSELNEFK